MKKLILSLIAAIAAQTSHAATIIVGVDPPDGIFDLGNMCLIVGTPGGDDTVVLSDFLLRTPQEQQAALTRFNAFPSGTLNSSTGIVIILKPHARWALARLNGLGLTVGDLSALRRFSDGMFAGVIGIDSPDVLAFGGSNFILDVGMTGAPVSFYLQDYTNTGVYANQFVSAQGLANDYRLGFVTQPAEPLSAPEGGNMVFLAALGFGASIFLCFFKGIHRPTEER